MWEFADQAMKYISKIRKSERWRADATRDLCLPDLMAKVQRNLHIFTPGSYSHHLSNSRTPPTVWIKRFFIFDLVSSIFAPLSSDHDVCTYVMNTHDAVR